jgi:hypothetical protein
MKERYYSKNIKTANNPLWNNHWQEAIDGETLYRWSPAGAGQANPASVLFLNGYRTHLKNRQEALSGSHYPMITCNLIRNIILKWKFIIGVLQKPPSDKPYNGYFLNRWYHFFPIGGIVLNRRRKFTFQVGSEGIFKPQLTGFIKYNYVKETFLERNNGT